MPRNYWRGRPVCRHQQVLSRIPYSTNPKSQIPNPVRYQYNPRMIQRRASLLLLLALASTTTAAQGRGAPPRGATAVTVLRPARVFDGDVLHEGWAVRVKGDRIDAVGSAASVAASPSDGATVIDLPGTTLMPGPVEG